MAKRSGAARSEGDDMTIVGAHSHPLRDFYQLMLTVRVSAMLGILALVFLFINALFAIGYMLVGGIEGVRPGSFADAFFFSAQTLGTIGYGAMHPVGFAPNVLAVAESLVSILFIAVATGLVFARFSRSSETMLFSDHPCIAPMDGVPTLVLRIGNDREQAVMDAKVRITMFRTVHTAEGVMMYRMKDLDLARDHTPTLGRTFTVMHHLDEKSPLFGSSPDSWDKDEIELVVNVVGTDATSLQPVYARCRYNANEVKWGARFADVLTELPNGRLQLDVSKFDELVECKPTKDFPYPRSAKT